MCVAMYRSESVSGCVCVAMYRSESVSGCTAERERKIGRERT